MQLSALVKDQLVAPPLSLPPPYCVYVFVYVCTIPSGNASYSAKYVKHEICPEV